MNKAIHVYVRSMTSSDSLCNKLQSSTYRVLLHQLLLSKVVMVGLTLLLHHGCSKVWCM